MLTYNSFLLITEKRNFIEKIKKFANVPEIYNWANELDSDMALWIADKLVKEVRDFIKKEYDEYYNKLDEFLKNGKIKNDKNKKVETLFKEKIELFKNRPKFKTQIKKVLDYVNSPLHTNKPNINKLSLHDAVKLSDEWHDEISKKGKEIIDEEGEIIMTFPDGFYWINLQTTKCKDEGEAMGHCATTTRGTTLLSLRRNKQPHVTISWNEDKNRFNQIKGKGNTKPVERYHPYIVDLICKLKVVDFRSEYKKTEDFLPSDLDEKLFNKLLKCNPNYVNTIKAELDEDDLRKMYRERLERDLLNDDEELYMLGEYIWNFMDDEKFVKDHQYDEIQYRMDDFKDYYKGSEEYVIKYIIDNYNDLDHIKEFVEKHYLGRLIQDIKDEHNLTDEEIENPDNEDNEDIIDMKNEIEATKNAEIEDLLTRLDINELEEILNEFSMEEDFIREEVENQAEYDTAKEHYDLYYSGPKKIGYGGQEYEQDFSIKKLKDYNYMNYFQEDLAIDWLVDNSDEEWLREYFGDEDPDD